MNSLAVGSNQPRNSETQPLKKNAWKTSSERSDTDTEADDVGDLHMSIDQGERTIEAGEHMQSTPVVPTEVVTPPKPNVQFDTVQVDDELTVQSQVEGQVSPKPIQGDGPSIGGKEGNEILAGDPPPVPPRSVYTKTEKYIIVWLASVAALFSSISSPIYLPVIPELKDYFHTTTESINLTITVYSIFQGLGPALWCPISDAIGRRPVYMCCVAIYIASCIALALTRWYAMLVVFRCIQSFGIATTVAIGSGVVSDITSRKERGQFIGIYSGLGLIGNAFGPIIGGGLSAGFNWRAIFWFLVIAAGTMMVVLTIFLPETNRFIALDGSVMPSSFFNKSPYVYFRRKKKGVPHMRSEDLPTPLVRQKLDITLSIRMLRYLDVIMLIAPAALHYTVWFMILTAQSTLLNTEYHFSTAQVGCSYLASGLGGLIGSLTSGRIMGWTYRKSLMKFKAQQRALLHIPDSDMSFEPDLSKFNIQRARLQTSFYGSGGLCVASIIFGWTIQYKVHYVVPLIMTGLASFSTVFLMNLVSTLLVDIFPTESASSTACFNLIRCLLCAAGLAAVDKMVLALGSGGAFTLMSGLCALSMSLMYTEMRIGYTLDQKRISKRKDLGTDYS